MLDLRNRLAHDYDLSTINAAFDLIVTSYADLFDAFEAKVASLPIIRTK